MGYQVMLQMTNEIADDGWGRVVVDDVEDDQRSHTPTDMWWSKMALVKIKELIWYDQIALLITPPKPPNELIMRKRWSRATIYVYITVNWLHFRVFAMCFSNIYHRYYYSQRECVNYLRKYILVGMCLLWL